ncbi:MAG TPA: fumarylacetoacetate hydrolase family protein [Xanthobacteraceae bacterium]|nr:fumarylacetoacetate hydrolase family protein [Xanthobacteraceae bacterium]
MKLVRFNGGRVGLVEGTRVIDITQREGLDPGAWPPVSMVRVIARYADAPHKLAANLKGLPEFSLADVRLDCPIDWPNKVIAFPANYHAHIEEQKRSKTGLISTFAANGQGFFLKSNSSLSGPSDSIVLPPLNGRETHHECELAIFIGKGGRDIPIEQTLDHIFGYSCLLDMVVRGKEERVMRKSFDTFCPLGPWIVTADEVPDPANIDLELRVNGEVRQKANTRDLIVDIPEMINMASSTMTLFPGDIIATGTPSGVGPIAVGDRIVSTVRGVGELALDVVRGERGHHVIWDKPAA